MKLKRVQKAYKIDLSKIEESFLFSEKTCYAKNRNKARSILLKEASFEYMCLLSTGKELTYLTIPVRRCEIYDKYLFENCDR